MRSYKRVLLLFLVAATALTSEVTVPKSGADENKVPFDVAKVFVQLNDTGGD